MIDQSYWKEVHVHVVAMIHQKQMLKKKKKRFELLWVIFSSTDQVVFCAFFFVGCRHGSFQRPGTLAAVNDYIERPLFYGAYFSIQVPPADLQDAQCKYSCEFTSKIGKTSQLWCGLDE